jgi:hypothetical protein
MARNEGSVPDRPFDWDRWNGFILGKREKFFHSKIRNAGRRRQKSRTAVRMGVLKNRSSIGFFNDGFKDNPSISRKIFGVRLLKRRNAALGDPPQGLFQQSQNS